MAEKVIRFYGRSLPFFQFSNFFHSPIKFNGLVYNTVEHFFQAMKFEEDRYISTGDCVQTLISEYIRNQKTPALAAKEGRRRDLPLRSDWEEISRDDLKVKDIVMLTGLRYKFMDHKELGQILKSTDDAHLIEASPIDYYWGEGADGSGQNKLGLLLEMVRAEL